MASIKITHIGFSLVSRIALFLVIWWLLSNGVADSWWIGIPAVLLAVMVSWLLLPAQHIVWYELLRFLPFFFLRSFAGGVDVAWRAFRPSMPIDPELIEYPLRLPPGLSRVIMANTINLLPGTLSAELEPNLIKVHVLDRCKDYLTELETLENHIAGIFNITLETSLER